MKPIDLIPRQSMPLKEQVPKELREAAEGMETAFTNMLIKQMRASVSESPETKNNQSLQIFREMLDNEYATQASKGTGIGLADLIIKQLMESDNQLAQKVQVRDLNQSDILHSVKNYGKNSEASSSDEKKMKHNGKTE